MNTVAILLAAGASSRLGQVKALLPLEGAEPAVRVLAKRYAGAADRCLVVTGYHAERVEPELAGVPGVATVRNPAPERGQLSSLQTALRALQAGPAPPDWFLFAPVDCFDIDDRVLVPFMEALPTLDLSILLVVPRSGEKHGHPVAARWRVASEFLSLAANETARTVVHRLRSQTQYVQIGTVDFLRDIDTREALEERRRVLDAKAGGQEP